MQEIKARKKLKKLNLILKLILQEILIMKQEIKLIRNFKINFGENEILQEILGRMKAGIYFFEGGYCYAALMRPNKVETRLQLHLGTWSCGC